MTNRWQKDRQSRAYLEAATVANDALIALNFLQAVKGRIMEESAVGRYNDSLKSGLGLVKELARTLTARGKGGEVSPEMLIVIEALFSGYFTFRSEEIYGKVNAAIVELERFLQGAAGDLRSAKEVLGYIATATSGELSAITLKVK